MALTPEEVREAARQARLELSEEEVQAFSEQLATVMQHVERLNQVDTTQVPPTYHGISTVAMREDKPHVSMSQEKALSQAPEAEAGYFKVPKITEG